MTSYRRPVVAMLALALAAGCSSGDSQPTITAPVPPIEATGSDTRTSWPAPPMTEPSPSHAAPSSPAPAVDRPPPPATTVGVPRGAAAPWSTQDTPDQVAAKYAAATWTLDSTRDGGPNAGLIRAAAYATPDLAGQLTRGGPTAGGGAAWASLAARHGWTTASAEVASTPDAPDTPEVKSREVIVTITARDDGGWTDATLYPQQVIFVQLTPDPIGGWRVSASTSAPQ